MNERSYQFTSKTGDIVRLPGTVTETIDIVKRTDIKFGVVKEVEVFPFCSAIGRLWLLFSGKTRFYDEDINKLVPVQLSS